MFIGEKDTDTGASGWSRPTPRLTAAEGMKNQVQEAHGFFVHATPRLGGVAVGRDWGN